MKPVDKKGIRRLISDEGIELISGTGNNNFIEVDKKWLLKIYKKNNWIHDLDDFDENDDKN